jgi:predicted negative regulator of RcsB-dependent stress response
MKHYFYAENDQKFGPFTIEELETKRLKKSTLVWTEGMSDWASADSITELKEILISEPPPLPKKRKEQKVNKTKEQRDNKTVIIQQTPKTLINTDLESSYKKETDATFVGVLLIIGQILLRIFVEFNFKTIANPALFVIGFLLFLLRIGLTYWVINIATRQNRNSTSWGWFAFFFPAITLIVIGQLKKLKLKIVLDGNLTTTEKVTLLLEKANQLFSSARYSECMEVLDMSYKLDDNNLDCIRLRGLTNYQLENFDNAEKDFKILENANSFLSEAYDYLGDIEIKKNHREKAITYWLKAEELNNEKAQEKLDLYNNFTGKYLLNNYQKNKKLTFYHDIDFAESKYIGGIEEIDLSEKLSKLRTELKGYKNGLEVELIKTLKIFHIAIAFYEIDDIIYNESDKILKLLLTDQKILKFKYDQSLEEDNEGLKEFCIRFKEKNGKDPTALAYLK